MKATDLFVRGIKEEGVTTIFGVSGEGYTDFMMSLEKADRIRFVLTRHEQGTAFTAEVQGRLTERLGNVVCPIQRRGRGSGFRR